MHTYIFGSVFISLGVWFAFKNISIEMMLLFWDFNKSETWISNSRGKVDTYTIKKTFYIWDKQLVFFSDTNTRWA